MDLLFKLKSPVTRDFRKCIDPLVGASMINAGIGLVSGLISNGTNKKLVRETNAQNRAMFDEQMALQQSQFQQQMDYQNMDWQRNRQAVLDDWARNNAYNDPSAQMARYSAAGLNPYMMMAGQNAAIANSESSAGGSSPSPASMPSIPQMQVPHDTTAEAFNNAISQYLQAKSVSADSDLKQQQSTQLAIDNRTRNVRNIVDLHKTIHEINDIIEHQKLSKAERDNLEQERLILEDTVTVLNQTFDARVKKPELDNYLLDRQARNLNLEGDRIQIQKNLDDMFARDERLAKLHIDQQNVRVLNASVSQILANTDLTKEQKETQVAHTAKTWLETNQINPDSEQGKLLLRQLQLTIRQMGADYWNPFNYIGKGFSGSASATKVVK